MCFGFVPVPRFFSVFLPFFFCVVQCTIDINVPEFQYLSDHLTERECHRLVAALHFRNFQLPRELNAAERRLPEDTPCIDLLLHWNSTPREGRGQTHVELCHRLNQIGRGDLAEWLSKTVFHELSKDLKIAVTVTAVQETTQKLPNLTEVYADEEEEEDEAAWWDLDSVLSIFNVFSIFTLILELVFMCFLYTSRKIKESNIEYQKVSARDY